MCFTTHATHQLESQGQASAAGLTHHKSDSPTGEPRTSFLSRVQMKLITDATHQLDSQGQPTFAGSKCSSPQKTLTNWRAKDNHCQQGLNAAHHRSHSPSGEPRMGMSAGSKFIAHHKSHSLSGEPREDVVRRVKMQLTAEATHRLESQGQVL